MKKLALFAAAAALVASLSACASTGAPVGQLTPDQAAIFKGAA